MSLLLLNKPVTIEDRDKWKAQQFQRICESNKNNLFAQKKKRTEQRRANLMECLKNESFLGFCVHIHSRLKQTYSHGVTVLNINKFQFTFGDDLSFMARFWANECHFDWAKGFLNERDKKFILTHSHSLLNISV